MYSHRIETDNSPHGIQIQAIKKPGFFNFLYQWQTLLFPDIFSFKLVILLKYPNICPTKQLESLETKNEVDVDTMSFIAKMICQTVHKQICATP